MGGRCSTSKRRSPRRRAAGRLRTAARLLAALAFVAGFALSSWVLRLDRIVVQRFEGHLFQVASKVLSAPTILYPGLDWRQIGLRETLLRLGYQKRAAGERLPVGTFHWSASRLRVHLRGFEHPSRSESPRNILVRLAGSEIESIQEVPVGREIGSVVLEPELVGSYYGPDREQRELVHISEVPQHLIDAILSIEDRRFTSHHGIDPRRILGALWVNIRAGGIQQGGSTLTQQLVKNFFLTPERTLRRKLQEAVMALLVEARYDKPAILESYLNEIYFGQRGATAVHGVGEAARLYFGKSASDLRLSESALLAAIIQSPNRISPHRDPESARRRRDLVLGLMTDQGRIDRTRSERARREPLRVSEVVPELSQSRYFLDVLRRQLPEVYDSDLLSSEGLHIYSTLDLRLQRAAASALIEGLEEIESAHPELVSEESAKRLQGCLVVLRPQTGEVLALVGGRSYAETQYDRCSQAHRPVGSVFKPFVYVAALEPRWGKPTITLASFLDDSPLEIDTPSGPWRPRNYDHRTRGRVSVREALERSLNIPAARLAQRVGINRVADVAARLGITTALPRVPSLALGTAALTPLELARAYATLANGGIRPVPHTFEDVVTLEGLVPERRSLQLERVLDRGTAFLAVSMLEGVVERGTAARVRAMGLRGPIAAKTGTTDEEHDLWFVGFGPEFVAVVWVGFDRPRSIGLPSSQGALPIWVRFARKAFGEKIRGAFLPPAEVSLSEIDPVTGALAQRGCPQRRREYFIAGTEPETVCPQDGDPRRPRQRDLLRWLRDIL